MNNKLNRKEFAEKIKESVSQRLGKGYSVKVEEILKENGRKSIGISIKVNKNEEIVPIIYLNELYEEYQQDENVDSCTEKFMEMWKSMVEWNSISAFSELRDWEKIKTMVSPVLLPAEENVELCKKLVHRDFLDLVVVYVINVKSLAIGKAIVKITKEMMKFWGITENELYNRAIRNSSYQLMDMEEFLFSGIFGSEKMDMKNALEPIQPNRMYILTNADKFYGAAAILDSQLLQMISGERNLFILPSSIHETLLVLDDGNYQQEDLDHIVQEVNREQVEKHERLQNHCYYYDGQEKYVRMRK